MIVAPPLSTEVTSGMVSNGSAYHNEGEKTMFVSYETLNRQLDLNRRFHAYEDHEAEGRLGYISCSVELPSVINALKYLPGDDFETLLFRCFGRFKAQNPMRGSDPRFLVDQRPDGYVGFTFVCEVVDERPDEDDEDYSDYLSGYDSQEDDDYDY